MTMVLVSELSDQSEWRERGTAKAPLSVKKKTGKERVKLPSLSLLLREIPAPKRGIYSFIHLSLPGAPFPEHQLDRPVPSLRLIDGILRTHLLEIPASIVTGSKYSPAISRRHQTKCNPGIASPGHNTRQTNKTKRSRQACVCFIHIAQSILCTTLQYSATAEKGRTASVCLPNTAKANCQPGQPQPQPTRSNPTQLLTRLYSIYSSFPVGCGELDVSSRNSLVREELATPPIMAYFPHPFLPILSTWPNLANLGHPLRLLLGAWDSGRAASELRPSTLWRSGHSGDPAALFGVNKPALFNISAVYHSGKSSAKSAGHKRRPELVGGVACVPEMTG
ncbi:hypothetical protein CPAR01_05268 [Colletotrichum paranaense]|uniref:Uncharacterized protein n=1 Tax=Colletotrichum paranaense TaxID=1914294 RepID=A0ABQ9SSB9_9PEZI|nr:uncharacterized protein CPAR01_05268 [Colletotrichum paranaense]KAK1541881.1 hypothetical protein CPAR01_05268 [Colletotrichum paranaense]